MHCLLFLLFIPNLNNKKYLTSRSKKDILSINCRTVIL